jgi:hypothetical protein
LLSWRKLIKIHEEEKEVKNAEGETEKKTWQLYEMGSYEWMTYQHVRPQLVLRTVCFFFFFLQLCYRQPTTQQPLDGVFCLSDAFRGRAK